MEIIEHSTEQAGGRGELVGGYAVRDGIGVYFHLPLPSRFDAGDGETTISLVEGIGLADSPKVLLHKDAECSIFDGHNLKISAENYRRNLRHTAKVGTDANRNPKNP